MKILKGFSESFIRIAIRNFPLLNLYWTSTFSPLLLALSGLEMIITVKLIGAQSSRHPLIRGCSKKVIPVEKWTKFFIYLLSALIIIFRTMFDMMCHNLDIVYCTSLSQQHFVRFLRHAWFFVKNVTIAKSINYI